MHLIPLHPECYTVHMYIAILGRQPNLSIAELESQFGAEKTRWFSSTSATVDAADFTVDRLGGTVKAGKVILNLPGGNWQKVSQAVVAHYSHKWSGFDGKITLGISSYGFPASAREVQKIGLIIKKNIKKENTSLRLIPNAEPQLNTATSHHNKLGLSPNKVELLIIRSESGAVIVAESTGAQNITALARRDQGRPKRDAFVGMLPPKLALLMVNLASGLLTPSVSKFSETSAARVPRGTGVLAGTRSEAVSENLDDEETGMHLRLLDPFCGTGVVLQEAALQSYAVYGTDLSDKMVDYSAINLEWLKQTKKLSTPVDIEQGDAMHHSWQSPINLVVSETYLGQPFSAPPSSSKLDEVKRNVDHITTSFLKNLRPQLQPGTPLCLAVPAWRDASGHMTHLPFIRSIEQLGYSRVQLKNTDSQKLIYYREDQVVARELLVLVST